MSINWNEIVEVYRSQSRWVWLVRVALVWIAFMWLKRTEVAYAERATTTPNSFSQRRVNVDYRAGTITMPKGDTYPVSSRPLKNAASDRYS